MIRPQMQAIFHRQIQGDLALLSLAQARFHAAGLGAEYYPATPNELSESLRFQPSDSSSYTVHLPRDINILDTEDRNRIYSFAATVDSQAVGFVIHCQKEVANRLEDYIAAVRQLDSKLREQGRMSMVFIEYTGGFELSTFVALHQAVRDCPRISACIDIGHIGIFQCQKNFRREDTNLEITNLKPHSPELRANIEKVQDACCTVLATVMETITSLSTLDKPLHFHLHDAHPSSTFSSHGVCDHLSFFQEIPIPFSYRGSYTLPTIFGPIGLQRIVAAARSALPDAKLSFTLEIHPTDGRQPLNEYISLFGHWQDYTNAEQMQYWIEVLLRNHRLLQDACIG